MIGTPGAIVVAGHDSAACPSLSILGQAAIGRTEMGSHDAYVGLDYIRMFSQASTVFVVELPDSTVSVGDSVKLPVVIKRGVTDGAGSTIREVVIQFSYRCELLDLYGDVERELLDGSCIGTISYRPSNRDVDTVWLTGITKLCSITSTALEGGVSYGRADRGRVVIDVKPGEIRQEGHCFSGGTRRLLFSAVGMSAFPQPAKDHVRIQFESLSKHAGTLILSDLTGNRILQMPVSSLQDGFAEVGIDVGGLAPGSYALCYSYGNGVSCTSVLVHK